MDEMKYEKVGEANNRAEADVIESFLEGEGIILGNSAQCFADLGKYDEGIEHAIAGINIGVEISSDNLGNFNNYYLAYTYLFAGDLPSSLAAIKTAQEYDEPQNNHNITTMYGIIALLQGERETAREAFTKSIAQADEILAKTPEYYSALDAKGLALVGAGLIRQMNESSGKGTRQDKTNAGKERPARTDAIVGAGLHGKTDNPSGTDTLQDEANVSKERPARTQEIEQAIETFRAARKIAPHAGVVKSVLRLFDELVKCDEEGVLECVREVIEEKDQQKL